MGLRLGGVWAEDWINFKVVFHTSRMIWSGQYFVGPSKTFFMLAISGNCGAECCHRHFILFFSSRPFVSRSFGAPSFARSILQTKSSNCVKQNNKVQKQWSGQM